LITPDKIDDWIHEAEERPSSAPQIIRFIANRLRELTDRNEELLAENIELSSGRKVEEYESRIANLEYRIELLKRQLGGDVSALELTPGLVSISAPQDNSVCLLIYNSQGQVLRVTLNPSELVSGNYLANLRPGLQPDIHSEEGISAGIPPRLLATSVQEELLFVFDSGRVVTMPVAEIPSASGEDLDWGQAFVQEPRGSEELVCVLPIARMSLFEYCVRTSRKAFVKKNRQENFESHVAKNFIGTGVKLKTDQAFNLTFCGKDDLYVMVSKEGFILSVGVNLLPVTIEEILRLSITDHIITTFVVGKKPSLLFVTQNGKAIHRDTSWLEPTNSFKTKGQSLFSKERRDAGVRVVGAAPVDESDWGVALRSDGRLSVHKMADLFGSGVIHAGQLSVDLLGFTAFQVEKADKS
jgi:DNA gyrase/topoisomerase IV subunit A